MAKKKARSYGPNTALIQGARDVAQSEALMSMAGGAAFAQTLTSGIIAGIEEQEKRNAKMDAHLDNLGGIQNISLLEEDYNKQAVTDFLRNGRDEYAKLAESYEKTKDRATLDKMDAIKFSFNNLNTQLQSLASEKKGYLDAYDKGQLVTLGNGDEKYTDMYTNNSQFSVDTDGNIGFGSGNEYVKFKDQAGKWNVKNNIGETYTLKQNLNARKLGESGKSFYRDDTKNLYAATFKETGPEGIMVMAKTDLTGDNEYYVGEGENRRKASTLSFESMWSQGLLDDKFYTTFARGTDSSWMYDKKNSGVLNDIMSEYYTDVTEYSYNEGKKNYKPKVDPAAAGRSTIPVNYGGGYITSNSANLFSSDIKNKESQIISPNGTNYEWNEQKNTYEQLTKGDDGKIVRTPRTNKWMLMNAGTWQQGYRVDDYEITEPSEEEVQEALSEGLKDESKNDKSKKDIYSEGGFDLFGISSGKSLI